VDVSGFDGLVLAGGRARRFGRDKRVEEFDGETLVGRAVRKLTQAGASTVYVATGPRVERLAGASAAVAICDEPPGCGPLGGIHAALLRTQSGVLVLAADLPLASVATLANLARTGAAHARPVALRSAAGWEPLFAYYPRSVLNDVRAAINQGAYAPQKLLDRLGAVSIAAPSPSETANVNTQEDLERILRDESET
jgi:molybdopterin-guanine dinucleotide biosynthesis protein A